MLDVAARGLDGLPAHILPRPHSAPPLPVHPALAGLLPGGLRRGSTVAVSGSVSLLLALLGTASSGGAWCALVGLPAVSAEAAVEYGVEPARLVCVADPGGGWVRALGALLEGFDVVVVRPPARLSAGDAHRLAARVRTREAVLVVWQGAAAAWPGIEVRLRVKDIRWDGAVDGHGRLRRREVTVTAEGRGRAGRPRSVSLWLPAAGGGIAPGQPLAPVLELPARAG